VDENEELAQFAGISAMPTFQVYKNGKKVSACAGGRERDGGLLGVCVVERQ